MPTFCTGDPAWTESKNCTTQRVWATRSSLSLSILLLIESEKYNHPFFLFTKINKKSREKDYLIIKNNNNHKAWVWAMRSSHRCTESEQCFPHTGALSLSNALLTQVYWVWAMRSSHRCNESEQCAPHTGALCLSNALFTEVHWVWAMRSSHRCTESEERAPHTVCNSPAHKRISLLLTYCTSPQQPQCLRPL